MTRASAATFLLFSSFTAFSGSFARASERMLPDDIRYLGAFRLPRSYDFGATGASYRAAGNSGLGSLLITGHDSETAEWAEVSIPALGTGAYGSLPAAQQLYAFVEYDGSLIEGETVPSQTSPGGVECIAAVGQQSSEKCYWNAYWWYSPSVAGDYDAVGMSKPNGTDPRGMWHVGPEGDPVYHGLRQGRYLFSMPQPFADQFFGGRSLIAGGHVSSGSNGGTQGPAMYAFRPWTTDNPTTNADLDALALTYYRHKYPACAGPNVGDPAQCDYPGFRACDEWEGGAFLEAGNKRAVILSGVKSFGTNRYGTAQPGDCSIYKGYHCDPFEAQIAFYDVDQLAASAAGAVDPWLVVPYATWRPSSFLQTRCPIAGGVAHDAATGRLFLIERGHLGDDNAAIVHVFQVTTLLFASNFESGNASDWQ